MRISKKFKTLSSFLNVIKNFFPQNFWLRRREKPENTANKEGLGPTKCDNVRPIWCSSFGEIVKHMKRTSDFWAIGDPQILAKLRKTSKNGATRTLQNAIQVH